MMSVQSEDQKSQIHKLLSSLNELTRTESNDCPSNLSTSDSNALPILTELKVLSRSATNSPLIATHLGYSTLALYAFGQQYPRLVNHEALRCLANTLLLNPDSRKIFNSLDKQSSLAEMYKPCANIGILMPKQDNLDSEFLCARIIFLLTYEVEKFVEAWVKPLNLCSSIVQKFAQHSKHFSNSSNLSEPEMEKMALIESLKLSFNLVHYAPELSNEFLPCISDLFTLLCTFSRSKSLDPPTNLLVNNLMVLGSGTEKPFNVFREGNIGNVLSEDQTLTIMMQLVDLLANVTGDKISEEAESSTFTLVNLTRLLYVGTSERCRRFLEDALLPTTSDRSLPLGKSRSVCSKLLRTVKSPSIINLGDAVLELYYELSGRSPQKMIENIGYGFASGYFVRHHIPVDESILSNSGKMRDEGANHSTKSQFDTLKGPGVGKKVTRDGLKGEDDLTHDSIKSSQTSDSINQPINLVTGQYTSAEILSEVPDVSKMTDTEKEREAERLFVLFERLRATGVMDVENPVEKAAREGLLDSIRAEEINSDETSDD